MLLHICQHRLEPVRRNHHIGVEQHDHLAIDVGNSSVVAGRKAVVVIVSDEAEVCRLGFGRGEQALHVRNGIVGRTVIHDNDLRVR